MECSPCAGLFRPSTGCDYVNAEAVWAVACSGAATKAARQTFASDRRTPSDVDRVADVQNANLAALPETAGAA